ncbi:N-6 DNA methylase [Streptomyces sp. NPDC007095]|uniref:N-6 DNA methylase n=1 Tax=Streptomyces sp. NPDC007095 TaxID=3154482 RepID=UPI00340BC486
MNISTATLEALAAEAPGDGGHRQIIRLAVNTVAAARQLPEPWPVDLPDDTAHRIRKLLQDLDGITTWGAAELGSLREQLLASDTRSASGTWYTPPQIAHPLTRAALSTITDLHLDDDPADVLSVSVLDPACGAGVFLIAAARILATAYVGLLYRTHNPSPLTIQAVMADVLKSCVYGIDTDPAAVDLAKSACWLETGGHIPITWLDNNIVIGNALNGDIPPALAGRLSSPSPLAIVGNPPYKDKAKGAAPWIEARRPRPGQARAADELWRPSLDEFRTPGQGRLEYALSNLHVYFWRWALWRAFETRLHTAAVAFLSPAAWLTSPAFDGMRAALRRTADQGLVINLTPEGMQPPVPTRVFPGVAQPVCAALFSRSAGPDPDRLARVMCATVTGTREEKFQQFDDLLAPSRPTS